MAHVFRSAVALLLAASTVLAFPSWSAPRAPETRMEPVTDTYFGRTVSDPFRWLEDLRAPEVRDWFTAQNTYARQFLDALPVHDALRARLETLSSADVRLRNAQWGGDRLFYEKRGPQEDRFHLFVRTG